jgi:hypothetical protein
MNNNKFIMLFFSIKMLKNNITILSKEYKNTFLENFIHDEYLSCRHKIINKLYKNNCSSNCLFFIGVDNSGNYYQIDNINKTKYKINNINKYINKYDGDDVNIYQMYEDINNYTNEKNNIFFSVICNNILTIYNTNTNKYDEYHINYSKLTSVEIYEISKIAKEHSIIVIRNDINDIDDIDDLPELLKTINNIYYLTNCFTYKNTFIRESIFCCNVTKTVKNIKSQCEKIQNCWVIINNYLRQFDDTKSHESFSKCMFYECIQKTCNANANGIYSIFLTRYLKPSNLKLFLFNNKVDIFNYFKDMSKIKNIKCEFVDVKNNYESLTDYFYTQNDYNSYLNIKHELLMYNFCKMCDMFENDFIFEDVFFNRTFIKKHYKWNIIVPYYNRQENLEYLIYNLKYYVEKEIDIMITIVEISDQITLNKYCDIYNNINYIWINKKKLGGHFNKCLCANIAHKLSKKNYTYDYILWHDVDCIVTNNFVNETRKIYETYDHELIAIHTFPNKFILHANKELSIKIRNNEIDINTIGINTKGILPIKIGSPGGSMLISVNLFEKIKMFCTSVFYNYSPEDEFILMFVKKYGHFFDVNYNNNFMIHLYHL